MVALQFSCFAYTDTDTDTAAVTDTDTDTCSYIHCMQTLLTVDNDNSGRSSVVDKQANDH